jgi:hypothetical protein
LSETKFTPGPWSLTKTRYGIWVVENNGRLITSLANHDFAYEHEQNNYAHLIAAAPELYEALEKLRDRYVQVIGNEGIECYVAKAALAKARGEA